MYDDETPERGEAARDDPVAAPANRGRELTVTGTYTDISGRPVFVIAAEDRPDAWIAVQQGGERDVGETR